nr:hypothetical protein [uncultured Flavobacterium sp.]
MTKTDFEEKLLKYSPFQFDGSKERYVFKDGSLFIDDSFYNYYKIEDTETGLKIELYGLMPFHANIIVDFGENEIAVIANYKGTKLIELPKAYRHIASKEGFFIFKSIK